MNISSTLQFNPNVYRASNRGFGVYFIVPTFPKEFNSSCYINDNFLPAVGYIIKVYLFNLQKTLK
jgi:hypothetical protein